MMESEHRLSEQLRAWAEVRCGTPDVAELRRLGGHAGLSYAFDVVDGPDVLERLVLRLAPPDQRGGTDVLRQAPLLRALSAQDFPVPAVRDSGDDPRWFGTSYLIVELLPGSPRSIDGEAPPPTRAHVEGAVSTLARLHRIDPRPLAAWDRPRSLSEEILAWDRAVERMAEAEWVADARAQRDRLLSQAPQDERTVVFHGDYQFSNLLFDDVTLTAVLDWEISGLGSALIDIGWFVVINEQASFAHRIDVASIPDVATIMTMYEAAGGPTMDAEQVRFGMALAAYRFGVIAGLNVGLHRSGRRVDTHWERIAPSVSVLLERSRQLTDST